MSPVSDHALREVALSRAEYAAICDRLGREPNALELGLFGSMWSEHCGYKHTKALLRTLPNTSDRLLVAPGAENAGVIDIGDGYAIAFKIESHNHPSAVEPVQGAATGVGGIVRDILAMGARPMALLNSLRFGDPSSERTRFLVSGVVSGISDYGNCIGVPNVGGEIVFDATYDDNPLVNVMCVGIIEGGVVMSARAEAPGDLLVIVGAKTGRDGIHGASGLASQTLQDDAEMRPAVQVGNPFMEKMLIEACLEAAKLPCVVGMQDCGAAGITSAAVEMADRSGMGIEIDTAKVPQREDGMTPYEVMLSESQERMLLAVKPDDNNELFALLDKWELPYAAIGSFTDSGNVVINESGTRHCSTPVSVLADAPEYSFRVSKPPELAEVQSFDFSELPPLGCSREIAVLNMLRHPNISSKRPVWQRYDHQVQNNTVAGPGGDAAVIRIKGTNKAIAVSTDGNGSWVHSNPYVGAAAAVAEACRNLSCVGATPIAITDGLNYGNPETEFVQYQLQESIAGIADAARALDVPVVSGNASLYNESEDARILPTPIIGAVGLIDDVTKTVGAAFRDAMDYIFVLGAGSAWDTFAGAGGSVAMQHFYDITAGDISIDLELEATVQLLCRELIRDGLIKSAHDCSSGGFFVALAESCIVGHVGAMIASDTRLHEKDWAVQMFGESHSRIIVTADREHRRDVIDRVVEMGIPCDIVGMVGSQSIQTPHEDISIPLDLATQIWESGLKNNLGIDDPLTVATDAMQASLTFDFLKRNRLLS